MDDKNVGLYEKYKIERVDGSEKHKDCKYFVLDLNHDPFSLEALNAYAIACAKDYPKLSFDLTKLIH